MKESQELEDSQSLHQAFLEEAQPAVYESTFPAVGGGFRPSGPNFPSPFPFPSSRPFEEVGSHSIAAPHW